jgi:hypothetical protein
MSSTISVDLSKAEVKLEGAAADVLAFLTKTELKISGKGPVAVAALGVLVAAVEQFMADASTGNLVAAVQQVQPVIGDVKSFIATL